MKTNPYLQMAGKQLAVCCLIAALPAIPAAAQELPPSVDETFALSSVDLLLALDADAVVRLDAQRFEVDGPGKATTRVRRAVTVMNPDGREEGRVVIFYDKFRRVKKLKGKVYDAQGKVVRKLKKRDIDDYSAISGFSLYEDSRVRVGELYHDAYPYTVEYEYEVRHDGVIGWPTWRPQWGGHPVELAVFELEAPAEMPARYAVRDLDVEAVVTEGRSRKTLRWEVERLPGIEIEPYGPALAEQVGGVYTAPATFEIEGAIGDMSSWQSFGRWMHALYEGRDVLPPEAVVEVKRLVADVQDDREKVRRLYAYLQAKVRYVSIQLGLGGWQPFSATYVHERGYGDCKALTNYMMALLRTAGIEAYPALIRGGTHEPAVLAGFPSNQFNHVILYVPLASGPVWLECTSQIAPFGHLGTFTEDRYALVVRPDGGELLRTPRSDVHANRQVRTASVELLPSGDARAQVTTRYTGNQQDRVRQALAQSSGRDREKWLHNAIDIPSFQVVRADFSSVDARERDVALPVELELPRYAAPTGTRLFLRPNLLERWSMTLPPMEERRQPVEMTYAFADADSIRYRLPAGFRVEAMPAEVMLDEPFGRYRAQVAVQEDGTLLYDRRLEITQAEIPAEQYDALRLFLQHVARADRAQVVLVRE